jgi:hypothetical protein
MESSSCTRDVLDNLTGECGHITHQVKSKISIKYLTCVLKEDEIELPPTCKDEQTWLSLTWATRTTCVQALKKDTSLWSTYDGFYRDIDSMCFAHTFDGKLRRIETGTVELIEASQEFIEAGQDIATGIKGLVKQVWDFQLETMPYLQSIENGVQNTLNEVSLLTTIIMKLYNLTERISDRIDVILVDLDNVTDKVSNLSRDMSSVGFMIKNNSVAIEVMSGELNNNKR